MRAGSGGGGGTRAVDNVAAVEEEEVLAHFGRVRLEVLEERQAICGIKYSPAIFKINAGRADHTRQDPSFGTSQLPFGVRAPPST